MCQCTEKDKIMGSYSNQTTLLIPDHMSSYRDARDKRGLSSYISVDTCCLPELELLWSEGVHTYGCCCGHNIEGAIPFINVREEDVDIALKLGFDLYTFFPEGCGGGTRRDTVCGFTSPLYKENI